jgi:chemotaxis protein MotC
MTTPMRFASGMLALVMACACAQAEEARAPSELIRELKASQDRIAQGDTNAHLAQRTLLARIAEQLAAANPDVWTELRNARAALAFVLSGGKSAVLKKLAENGALSAIDDKLVRGVLAYAEGRDADALELLGAIDARELAPNLGGHIALAKAELIAKKDPKQALESLDEARLLAPGTLIEEAALRRQVSIVAASGEFDRFALLSTNYLRRFGRSVYALGFRRQFAIDVAARADTGEADHASRLQAVLEALEPGERRDLYLAIAREGLMRGRAEVARFAASHAGPLFEAESVGSLRARLYEAAALVLTDDIDKGAAMLEAIDRAKLGEEGAELASAAGAVAAEIRRLPPIAGAVEPAGGTDLAATFKVAGTAQKTMAQVDELLIGAKR